MKEIRKISIITAVVLLITVLAVGAFAEFTRSYRAKRVIAAYEPAGLRFSSNILEKSTPIVSHAKYIDRATAEAIKTGGSPVVSEIVTVCNYPQDNSTMIYPQDITYNLFAKLIIFNENAEATPTGSYTVSVSNGANTLNLSSSQGEQQLGSEFTLPAGEKTAHEFTVTFDNTMLTSNEKVFLKLRAVPTVTFSDINATAATLTAYLHIAEMPLSVATGWTLSQTDEMTDEQNNPKYFGNYYGYNYRLSGTGTGTATIKWDSTKLTLNEIFPEQVYSWVKEEEEQKIYDAAWQSAYEQAVAGGNNEAAATNAADVAANSAVTDAQTATEGKATDAKKITTEGNYSSMTIPVDSDYRNSFEIIFYPKNRNDNSISSTDNLTPAVDGTQGTSSYIFYSYTETQ